MQEWRQEDCSERPLEFQRISDHSYMQRRNITEIEHEAEGSMPAYTSWRCECREIAEQDYINIQVDRKVEDQQSKIDYLAMMTDVDLEEA